MGIQIHLTLFKDNLPDSRCSPDTLKLEVSTGSEWIKIAPLTDSTPPTTLSENYKSIRDCVSNGALLETIGATLMI